MRFLECVRRYSFVYSSIVMNKARLTSEGFKHKYSFMKCAIRFAFSAILRRLDRATAVYDSKGSRDFKRTLQTYLKRELNDEDHKRITKVRARSSHRDNLVQLADMVCGSVARSLARANRSSDDYRAVIREGHEVRVQFWPPD